MEPVVGPAQVSEPEQAVALEQVWWAAEPVSERELVVAAAPVVVEDAVWVSVQIEAPVSFPPI